jgi:tRNA(Ile2) C34 agmatinyltransferase TiaS
MEQSPDSVVARSHLEAEARIAYEIYAHRAGRTEPFEKLTEIGRMAWREIVEYFENNPECNRCGESLFCLDCDADAVKEYEKSEAARRLEAASVTKEAGAN